MDLAKYAKDDAWAMHPGLVENRETSLLGTLKMWEKWNGKADDRIRVWFGARTPGGQVHQRKGTTSMARLTGTESPTHSTKK
jgi:hypothetical protein